MKLLFCTRCYDIRKIPRGRVRCNCAASWAQYAARDSKVAIVGGEGKVIAIDSCDFRLAWLQSVDSVSVPFNGYFLSERHESVKRE